MEVQDGEEYCGRSNSMQVGTWSVEGYKGWEDTRPGG